MKTTFDFSENALWKKRFMAPRIALVELAAANPERGIVCTDMDGLMQLYAWDPVKGTLEKRTDLATGIRRGFISSDGNSIIFHKDKGGNEIGHFCKMPWEGGEPVDITPDMGDYAFMLYTESLDGKRHGFSTADDQGFHMFTRDSAGLTLFSVDRQAMLIGPVLSGDGDIALALCNERTRTTDFCVEAYDVATGEKIAELWDGEGTSMGIAASSPIAGDGRFVVGSNKGGYSRPSLWDPKTGTRTTIGLEDTEGDMSVRDWSPDGHKLLINNLSKAVQTIYEYEIEPGILRKVEAPPGTYSDLAYRGTKIIGTCQNGEKPQELVKISPETGSIATIYQTTDAPEGSVFTSVQFPSADGAEIQGWLGKPDGAGPYPTIVHTHGGPSAAATDTYSAEAQAWIDHGFAYLSINYRGSTTFGADFKNAINGKVGDLEVQDVAAGVGWLLENNVADGKNIFKTGASYGGYLTLMSLGKLPKLFAGGMAVVAIADWHLMYEDQAETLKGFQRALFGGGPETMGEQYTASSPVTYLDNVQAPILIIQGRNDTRCPSRQMEEYVARAEKAGKKLEVHWFDAGHGSLSKEDQIKHQQLMMEFVAGRLS